MGPALPCQPPWTDAQTLTSILPACSREGHNRDATGECTPPQQWTLARARPAGWLGGHCGDHHHSHLAILNVVGQIQGPPWQRGAPGRWQHIPPPARISNRVIPSVLDAHQGGKPARPLNSFFSFICFCVECLRSLCEMVSSSLSFLFSFLVHRYLSEQMLLRLKMLLSRVGYIRI